MPSPSPVRVVRAFGIAALVLCATHNAWGQLNENCSVSVLNRTVRVNPDGSWVLPNAPANFGQVRARATCVLNGQTVSGESALFTVPPNGAVNLQPIVLGQSTPIPVSLTIGAATHTLTQPDATALLTVSAHYADGTIKDVTAASTGTQYTISNAAIATVSADGLVKAALGAVSGTVVIQATHEGASGLTSIQVLLGGASHGGIPDSWAIANGLNPNDPVMPFEDPDRDGLTNLEEFQRGTDPHNPDTDGDGLPDGQEVALGTNPLVTDTDGDGVRDGLEVQTGSDPRNAASVNFAQALNSILVGPSSFVITFNTILGEASRQLMVTGNLKDGTTIDLTSTARGTNYTSSDLNTCSLGAAPGRIFAGMDGTCTITITNSGFQAMASGTIRTFAPTPLSFVDIPGFANNLDVSGNFAYVAAGAAGLQVVDVSNRSSPRIVAAYDTPGNANDVRVVGPRAYVADGPSGLQIIDISNPTNPTTLGNVDTPGNAADVFIVGNRAFVADGASGLQIIDVTNPASPARGGSIATSAAAKGVAVSGNVAVVAIGGSGIQVIDVANASSPSILGTRLTGGDARDVEIDGSFAFVADVATSLTSVDITDPRNPVVASSTPSSTGGLLQDVALAGRFAFGADVFFVNGVPIVDVNDPANPTPRAILDFRNFRDDNGTGIAVDSSFVYLTAERGITENGTFGDTRLYIGQYLALEDTAGIPPTVRITAPAAGETVIEGTTIPVTVDATDDIQVVSVDFLVDGQLVFTDSAAPYQFNVPVPTGVGSLTLSARAIDLGGNTSLAPDVRLNVIPDPGTTVVGRVVDSSQAPIAGAIVSTLGRVATSGGDGTFSIANVPTIQGNVTVACSATVNEQVFTGASAAFAPVRGGTTNVDDIVLGACVQPPAGLVSWWPGEGNANDVQGTNHGTFQNGASFAAGMVGQAFSFDGSNYVSVPSASNLNLTGAMTIEGWVYLAVNNFNNGLVFKGPLANSQGVYSLGFYTGNSNRLTFRLNGQIFGPGEVNSSTSLNPGQWYHVAATYDGATEKIYVNGILDGSASYSSAINTNNDSLIIGGYFNTPFLFNGKIDELAIYNRALSASEVQAIFNAGSEGKCKPITPIPYLSSGYRYLVVPFGQNAGFEQPGFDDSQFNVGDAGFGTGGFCPLDSTIRTPWPLFTDILLRKTFNLPATVSTVKVAVAIDNDVQVFVNGADISGGLQFSGGCAVRDRFIFSVPDSVLIKGGTNLLALRARDQGGLSYVDVEVRAN